MKQLCLGISEKLGVGIKTKKGWCVMSKSHASVWPSEAPTPDQMKEFFAQVSSGKITGTQFQRLLIGGFRAAPIFTTDLAKYGMVEVLKEGPRHPEGLEVEDLELKEFFYRDETSIKGEELQKRAKAMYANFGLHTAERILRDQHKVSKDWQDKYLVFPGTEVRGPRGYIYVPHLFWLGQQWCLDFHLLYKRWHSNARLVRASK